MTQIKQLNLTNLEYIRGEIIKNIADIEQYQEEVEYMYTKNSQLYIEKMEALNIKLSLAQETMAIITNLIDNFFEKESDKKETINTTKKKKHV